ncbi:hypothetical protein [Serratia sp. AKBS12]|nr:hypothetical protein [Serratia sp. AKBS12]
MMDTRVLLAVLPGDVLNVKLLPGNQMDEAWLRSSVGSCSR